MSYRDIVICDGIILSDTRYQGHLFFSSMTAAINLPDQYIILEYRSPQRVCGQTFYNKTTQH